MEIIDPVALGDVACTRASVKWVWDRTGTLVSVPANTLAVTYDPSDLGKAPYALVEGAATNLITYSEQFDNAFWKTSGGGASVSPNVATGLWGGQTADKLVEANANMYHLLEWNPSVVAGETYSFSLLARAAERSVLYIRGATGFFGGPSGGDVGAIYDLAVGQPGGHDPTVTPTLTPYENGDCLLTWTCTATATQAVAVIYIFLAMDTGFGPNVNPVYQGDGISGAILKAAQFEKGPPSSYIPTAGATVTRAADVIPPGAGVIFSNVPETDAPAYAPGTYAAGAQVISNHIVYESKAGSNTADPTDATKWTKIGATNQRAMLDQYNNTQTTNPDEILLVVSPQAISQGLYLGNLDGTEVRWSLVDLTEGLISRETTSLIVSNSGSSFFNWCFKRIKRQTYFVTKSLPVYANAIVTICIRKIGSTPKCGMCAVGPLDEFGPSLMGLSTEGKDYSTTTFNSDGTSNTIVRPYAKRMSVDVSVDNTDIDYIQERLFELRQKPIVIIGGPYGSTAVFGRIGSFKNVIESFPRSKMALQIEGSV